MPYDKYRNWVRQGVADDEIKLQVIKDLEDSADPTDKLEILDSFQSYVERNHQEWLAEYYALWVQTRVIGPLLVAFAKSRMPGSRPISRPRAASVKQ